MDLIGENYFSFIVISKNEEMVIGECIKSIFSLGMDLSSYEVLLVDNGSTDDTLKIANEMNVQCYVEPNLKVGGLRNFAVARSAGNVLVFLDADVVISREWFFTLLKHISNGSADCAFAPECWYGSPTLFERLWLNIKGLTDSSIKSVSWCQSGAFMITRESFLISGGFNENLSSSEDYDFGKHYSKMFTILRDGTVYFEHLRTPKNIKSFFFQQIWHGRGSSVGFRLKGKSLYDILVHFFPLVFLILNFAYLFIFIFFFHSFTELLILIILLNFVYLILKIPQVDRYFIFYLFIIYVFLVARGLSFIISGKRIS